jgi:hypothetical protein
MEMCVCMYVYNLLPLTLSVRPAYLHFVLEVVAQDAIKLLHIVLHERVHHVPSERFGQLGGACDTHTHTHTHTHHDDDATCQCPIVRVSVHLLGKGGTRP